jgi:hypothetical protein
MVAVFFWVAEPNGLGAEGARSFLKKRSAFQTR